MKKLFFVFLLLLAALPSFSQRATESHERTLNLGIGVGGYSGYYGNTRRTSGNARPLFLDAHVGAEYHASPNLGIFVDFSTGVSTAGLAFH